MSGQTIDFYSDKFDEMVKEMSEARLFREQVKQMLMIMLPMGAAYIMFHVLFYAALILPVFYSGLMAILAVVLMALLVIWGTKRIEETSSCYRNLEQGVFVFTMGYLVNFWVIQYGISSWAVGVKDLQGSVFFWLGILVVLVVNIVLPLVLSSEGTLNLGDMKVNVKDGLKENLVSFVKSDRVYERIYEKYYDALLE